MAYITGSFLYYNGIQGFINYVLSNLRNISGCHIRCSCKKFKNKKNYQFKYCNDASSIKRVYEKILVLTCTQRNIYFSRYPGKDDGWVNL